MSWKDRIYNSKFSIKCGDGKTYYPLWIRGEKGKDFNVKAYDFITVDGSFVERRKPKSNKFPFTFYFQGDTNIDQANDFEVSANDSRPWEVNHPFYGVIFGQPTNIKRNDNSYNVTQITVDFWESVSADFPNTNSAVNDRVTAKKSNVLHAARINFVANANPKTSDIEGIKDSVVQTRSAFLPLLDDTDNNKVNFENVYSSSLNAVDTLVNNSKQVITKSQQLYNLPSGYTKPLISKLKAFEMAFEHLKGFDKKPLGKLFFESQGATAIANMSEMSVYPLSTDYITRDDVQAVSQTLLKIYNDYLSIVDQNQVHIYDIENTYSPNADLQRALYEIITDAIGDLFTLAFAAKQQRITYTTKNTNLFLITHQYFGLDPEDVNLEKCRKINNIKNDELFRISKGREIKYFV